jgi:hypothetical protein
VKNKLSDLRDHLFETIERLKDGDKAMPLEKAKTIADVAQVIINSAKVEVDFLKATDQRQGTGFMDKETPALPQRPALVKR